MNKLLLLLFCSLLIAGISSCGQNESDDEQKSLEQKKDELREKRKTLNQLQGDIQRLESEIEARGNDRERESKVLVELDTLRKQDLKHFTVFQGNVDTRNRVTASAEVSGRIISLAVEEGQAVRSGQVIARLDTEVIDKQMAEVETTLSLAKDVYERQKRLWDQNIGSEVQYLEAKNSMERLERNLEVLQSQKARAVVRAPKSGVLDQLLLREGELVSPGVPIGLIVDTQNLKLSVDVPENFLARIDLGDEVEIHFPSLDETIPSRISRIGSSIDPENRTFRVEANLPSGHSRIMPHLMARMSVNDRTAENTLVVPLNIVQYELGGRAYVYVAEDQGDFLRAKKNYVETGLSYRGQIEIQTGLREGDLLIVRGHQDVSSDQRLTRDE